MMMLVTHEIIRIGGEVVGLVERRAFEAETVAESRQLWEKSREQRRAMGFKVRSEEFDDDTRYFPVHRSLWEDRFGVSPLGERTRDEAIRLVVRRFEGAGKVTVEPLDPTLSVEYRFDPDRLYRLAFTGERLPARSSEPTATVLPMVTSFPGE
jgi:hypothetical protein